MADGMYIAMNGATARERQLESIADNLANLAEYSGSANTHFDSVRPMNHKYVVKAGDLQSGGSVAGGSGSGSNRRSERNLGEKRDNP